jgi:diaminopropionate ammonia-lyase
MQAITRLATPTAGDPAILAGASGACGVAALIALQQHRGQDHLRAMLGVGTRSRVMVIVTEGRT